MRRKVDRDRSPLIPRPVDSRNKSLFVAGNTITENNRVIVGGNDAGEQAPIGERVATLQVKERRPGITTGEGWNIGKFDQGRMIL